MAEFFIKDVLVNYIENIKVKYNNVFILSKEEIRGRKKVGELADIIFEKHLCGG